MSLAAVSRENNVAAHRTGLPTEKDVDTYDTAVELANKIEVQEYPIISRDGMKAEEGDLGTTMKPTPRKWI